MRDYLNPARIYTDRLGVSDLESTTDNELVITPTVKESSSVRASKDSATAPVRENLTTENAESAEKRRVGEPEYLTALDWFKSELTALYLWAKDPCMVEPLTLYELEHAEAIASYFLAAIQALAKPGNKPVTNHGTEPRQSAECAWCGPGRMGWFSVQFWVRSCYGKRKWMSVTQDWKYKVKFCPVCGKKVEGKK